MLEHLHPAIEMLISIAGIIAVGSAFAIISNNTVERVAKNQPIIKPGPYCPSCAVTLSWKDLIPIYSYLKNRGKCPYCGVDVPQRNFIVEIAEIAWVAIFITRFGWSYPAMIEMLFGMGLIAVIIIESENRLLVDTLLLFMGMLGVIYILAYNQPYFPFALLSMGIGIAVLLLYNILKILTLDRVFVSFPEAKFGAVLGIFLGVQQLLLCIFIAWVIGAAWGSFNIKFFNKDYNNAIPGFPSLLALSGLIIIIAGNAMIDFYLKLIF